MKISNKMCISKIFKFIKRFKMMEKLAQERDLSLANLNLNELDELWNEVKKLNS